MLKDLEELYVLFDYLLSRRQLAQRVLFLLLFLARCSDGLRRSSFYLAL